jgi:hypothetical protein
VGSTVDLHFIFKIGFTFVLSDSRRAFLAAISSWPKEANLLAMLTFGEVDLQQELFSFRPSFRDLLSLLNVSAVTISSL